MRVIFTIFFIWMRRRITHRPLTLRYHFYKTIRCSYNHSGYPSLLQQDHTTVQKTTMNACRRPLFDTCSSFENLFWACHLKGYNFFIFCFKIDSIPDLFQKTLASISPLKRALVIRCVDTYLKHWFKWLYLRFFYWKIAVVEYVWPGQGIPFITLKTQTGGTFRIQNCGREGGTSGGCYGGLIKNGGLYPINIGGL